MQDFYYNKELSIGLPTKTGRFSLQADSPTWLKMQSGIGQGETLCTPLQNLCMVSAIANHGKLHSPQLFSEVRTKEGTVVKHFEREEERTLMSESESATLTEFMRSVVTEGTASALKTKSYAACGKPVLHRLRKTEKSKPMPGLSDSRRWRIPVLPLRSWLRMEKREEKRRLLSQERFSTAI